MSNLFRHLRAAQRGEGISTAKLSVLGQIYRSPALSATELARLEGVKLQSLTRLLAELEADAWISRSPHPKDGRQSLLSLAPLGKERLIQDVRHREAALAVAVEAQLSAAERALLVQACALLDRLSESMASVPSPHLPVSAKE